MKKEVRYQQQPWYKKLILDIRYETPVPYFAFKCWLLSRFKKDKPQFWLCWRISKGMADCKKKHYYTWDEVKERMDKKLNGYRKSGTEDK